MKDSLNNRNKSQKTIKRSKSLTDLAGEVGVRLNIEPKATLASQRKVRILVIITRTEVHALNVRLWEGGGWVSGGVGFRRVGSSGSVGSKVGLRRAGGKMWW